MVVIIDSLHSWKLVLVNPVYELPRATTLIGNFLNLGIKESSFSDLDDTLEVFPIFKAFRFSVNIKGSPTLIIPPNLGVLCDLDSSSVRLPHLFDISS